MKYLRHKIIRIFLLIFFGLYIVGNSLFTHSHEINGVKFTHSHFFNLLGTEGQTTKTHEHSEKEILTIQILNHAFLACAFVFAIGFVNKLFYQKIKLGFFTPTYYHLFLLDTKNLRAPPIL